MSTNSRIVLEYVKLFVDMMRGVSEKDLDDESKKDLFLKTAINYLLIMKFIDKIKHIENGDLQDNSEEYDNIISEIREVFGDTSTYSEEEETLEEINGDLDSEDEENISDEETFPDDKWDELNDENMAYFDSIDHVKIPGKKIYLEKDDEQDNTIPDNNINQELLRCRLNVM